jgi:drug/metabolite transporter (DMT)-like permease
LSEEKGSALKLLAAFIAVYVIWGSTYLGIKFAIESIPPFLMASLRFLIAGSILFLISNKSDNEKLTFAQYKSTAIVGLLLLLGGNGGVVWAEQYLPSGLTALLVSTVPVWVVVISWLFPQEKKNQVKNVIGVTLGFAGLYFLVSPGNLIKGSEVDLLAALVLIGATLSWSIGSVYTHHAVLPKSSMVSTSFQMIFGGLGLLAASLISGEPFNFNPSEVSTQSFLAFLYLILFGSLIAFSAYIWLLKKAGASKATTYAYVNPVVAVILGWLLAGEEITLRLVIAAIIIVAAVVIILTDFRKLERLGKIKKIRKISKD